jgi:tRNA (cytidine32/uridine32-2'-O)-methyltransferase
MKLPIRIVLVGTTHPGNIGASARAMKTMGLDRLWLVDPVLHPSAEASARATGAADILHAATITESLEAALEGCRYIVGASARQRSLPWPLVDPRTCAEKIVTEACQGEVALVFGREQSGLSNDELKRCHALVRIPTNPEFSSLNLAMAVQLIAYEVQMASGSGVRLSSEREAPLAKSEQMEAFYAHLERALVATDFLNPDNPRHLMQRLRRMFNRTEPDVNEINILRGILTALAPGTERKPGAQRPKGN